MTLLIGMVLIGSMMLVIPQAQASTALPAVPLGTFQPDPQIKNLGGYPSDIGKWFSASWGINQAYQVGATDQPYNYLFGNFFQNGQQVVQPVQASFTINWSALGSYITAFHGTWETPLGAPNYDYFSTGINTPIEIFFVQNSTTLEYNVTTTQESTTFIVPSFMPTSAVSGAFYIIFEAEMYNWPGNLLGYEPIYIGEGQFQALNAHVSGKPTTTVDSQITGASALLNWTFSAGEWNATFIHYRDNNPADLNSSNLQALAYYNFTYAKTGGISHLRYNFSSSQPSGVYGWDLHEGITHYGTSFIVFNNITSEQAGDSAPSVSIWIKPAEQSAREIVGISVSDAKSTTIYLQVSVWFSNDMYTVPSPSYENVLYYFVPYAVSNKQNITLNFTDTFYGQLNVEVISHNTYGMWNNSYASSVVKSDVYNNGSGGNLFVLGPSWLVEPFSGPLNALFLVAGIGVLLFSIKRSGMDANMVKRAMRGMGGQNGGFFLPTHYMAAIVLIAFSVINWALLFATVTSWGHLIP